jgi:DNA-directed RNA polymerase subunit RPC12/RpoP
MCSESVHASDSMIEFSCIYCGQPVRVGPELAQKQIECPACGHSIRVCANKPGEALRSSSARTADSSRRDAEHWSRMSDEEIKEAVLLPALPAAERRRLAFKRVVAPWLPRYDDLTLFTFALALAVLLAVDSDWRQSLLRLAADQQGSLVTASCVIVAIGALFSLINVAFRRDKSEFERTMMLFFAILVTMITGVSAGRPMLSGGYGALAIFPLWNAVNGFLLLALAGLRILDDDCLTDEAAGWRQVLLATVAVTLLVAVCHYLFKLDTLTTFSIAVAYTMSLHHMIRRLFEILGVVR